MVVIRTVFNDKYFFSTLLKLALPIAFQNLIIASLSMVDVVMIGQLNDTAVAAVGLADQVFFLLILLLFGISSGAAIFTAQYWGQRDIRRIRSVLGISLMLSLAGGLIFTLIATLIPEQVLGIYSTDPAVVDLGSSYLRIVGLGYMAMAVTFSYSAILRSTGEVKLPMVVSLVALSLNTGLNYGLIFGNFGLPKLGVEGAAIATAMARFLECGLMLALVYRFRLPAAATAREMLDLKLVSLKRFFVTSVPVIFTEVLWSLGITTYNVVYARIGTEAIAAVNISITIDRVLFVVFIGISNACAIMIGNRIGANEEWKAFEYARRFLVLGPVLAVLIGLLLVSTAGMVLTLYNVSDVTISYARNILIIMGLMLPIRVSNLLLLVGILRSGGDTHFAFLIDVLTVWGVGVPLAFTGAFIFGLPVYGVYMLVMTEEILKVGLGLWRLFSRKWIHNLAVPA